MNLLPQVVVQQCDRSVSIGYTYANIFWPNVVRAYFVTFSMNNQRNEHNIQTCISTGVYIGHTLTQLYSNAIFLQSIQQSCVPLPRIVVFLKVLLAYLNISLKHYVGPWIKPHKSLFYIAKNFVIWLDELDEF